MTRSTILLAAASALAMSPPAASAAEMHMHVTGPVVEVTVTEVVKADPDLASLSAGVTNLAPTAVEAMRENARQMNRVVDRIEALGVDRDDIQTTGINLNPEYVYEQETNQQRFSGYRAMNRVSVTLRNIDRTGEVLLVLCLAYHPLLQQSLR